MAKQRTVAQPLPVGRQPENRSDQIMLGVLTLPVIHMQVGEPDQPMRRAFREPVRPPLFYNEGAGPDEAVTSRRPIIPGLMDAISREIDHDELRPIQGVNKQPYALGSNDEHTLNGEWIRGT